METLRILSLSSSLIYTSHTCQSAIDPQPTCDLEIILQQVSQDPKARISLSQEPSINFAKGMSYRSTHSSRHLINISPLLKT